MNEHEVMRDNLRTLERKIEKRAHYEIFFAISLFSFNLLVPLAGYLINKMENGNDFEKGLSVSYILSEAIPVALLIMLIRFYIDKEINFLRIAYKY